MQQKLKKISGVVLAFAFAMTAVQARDFRSADSEKLDSPNVLMIKKMGTILGDNSNSKHKVKVYANGTLGSEKDAIEQVRIGAMDMVRVNISSFYATVPESAIPSLPFLFRDMKHFRVTMNGVAGEKILNAFDKAGLIGLAMWDSGARSVYSKKPIKSLADLKDMKIAVQQSDLISATVQALGASPVALQKNEVTAALKSGQVDAAENTLVAYMSAKHAELAPEYSSTHHVVMPEVLLFSKKVWETLTKAEQDALRGAAKEAVDYYNEIWAAKEEAAKKAAATANVKMGEPLNRAELIKAVEPVWEKFAGTPPAKALVQEIVNAQ